jgi:hypothetical protein
MIAYVICTTIIRLTLHDPNGKAEPVVHSLACPSERLTIDPSHLLGANIYA